MTLNRRLDRLERQGGSGRGYHVCYAPGWHALASDPPEGMANPVWIGTPENGRWVDADRLDGYVLVLRHPNAA